ncbi:MAG: hypothetical protein AAF126_01960 [Chloroflexota bacterium]
MITRKRFYYRDGQVWDGTKSLFHIVSGYEAGWAVDALNTQYEHAEESRQRIAELEAENARLRDAGKWVAYAVGHGISQSGGKASTSEQTEAMESLIKALDDKPTDSTDSESAEGGVQVVYVSVLDRWVIQNSVGMFYAGIRGWAYVGDAVLYPQQASALSVAKTLNAQS